MDINDCLEKGILQKINVDEKLVQKEINEAYYDLESAKKAFEEGDFKWGIVKSYYSLFHAARAVLFELGYREKRHFAVRVVLEELNKKGKLEMRFINDFNAAMSSREDADYHYVYSKDIAEHNLSIAEEFIQRVKRLLNELKPKYK
ncbi:HEPN domain-containing protein [Candidatus Woesearchaeota archaeon]|nr:HEPN domain-containing protein [Candidatus Woesearchaeota archaeon]